MWVVARSTPTSGAARRGGIDFTTLTLTALASGVAAYTCSKLWAPGTLPSAAATPVLVAIIREGLQRPTEVVARAVPVRGVVRSARPPDAPGSVPDPQRAPVPEPPTRVASPEAQARTRVAQPGAIGGPVSGLGPRWRLAVITGLLGFVISVVVFTVPELIAGGSASGGGRATTVFGGKRSKDAKRERERDRQRRPTSPGSTVTAPGKTVTAPPSKRTPRTTTTPAPKQTVPPPPTTTAPAPPASGQP